MITSLTQMGFIPEKLPLSYPHNSLGGFFNDVYSKGGMLQTGRTACRSENLYGAYLVHKKSGRRVAVDFLNIPGETFGDAKKQLLRYEALKSSIQRVEKGVFCVSTWENPSGRVRNLLEPQAVDVWIQEQSGKNSGHVSGSNFQEEYQPWSEIRKRLDSGGYQKTKRKSIDGKYLLDHFFEFNADSIFATLCDVWNQFAPKLSKTEYVTEHGFNDFYYMYYSVHATDLVICDKLFISGESTSDHQQNYLDMIDVLAGLFPSVKQAPQTYLAFRGTDLMMRKYAETYQKKFLKGSKETRCNDCYEEVMKQICTLIDNRGNTTSLDCFGDDILINPSPKDCTIPTGGDFVTHVRLRVGGDSAHGFRALLQASKMKKNRLKSNQSIPPHVFFTATPIDGDLHFYKNDPVNTTRFIYHNADNRGTNSNIKTKYAFHVEMARHRTHHLCFGTLQLLQKILKNNNINI